MGVIAPACRFWGTDGTSGYVLLAAIFVRNPSGEPPLVRRELDTETDDSLHLFLVAVIIQLFFTVSLRASQLLVFRIQLLPLP